jgi:protein-L-isoaspartate(D-aspartate) O-methyltransferase
MEEQYYIEPREQMIEKQLIARGIKDQRVLDAMRSVPRHLFVDCSYRHEAYKDYPLPIGCEQTISQPYIVALMTESLQLKGSEKVLEIGTGSGYQTAVLAELARHVCTVERHGLLSSNAEKTLQQMNYNNISFKKGDGTLGWPEKAPFDGILVAAAAKMVPPLLLEQLSTGGRLVIPIGDGLVQELVLISKDARGVQEFRLCGCRFVPLIEDQKS